MNCHSARQTLELHRSEESLPETIADAECHVSNCPDCQEAIEATRQFDTQISQVCCDVPVPPGLKDRLLAELTAVGSVESSGEEATVPLTATAGRVAQSAAAPAGPSASRRRWLVRLSLAAACVVAAVGFGVWLFQPAPPTLALDEVTDQGLGANPAALAAFLGFHRSVLLVTPKTMDTRDLDRSPPPVQLGSDAALYSFTFALGGQPCQGRLIVMPRASVIDPPRGTNFLPAAATYNQSYLVTSWVEGDLVYVCCVTGGEGALRRLVRGAA